jgi:hypothetical protein
MAAASSSMSNTLDQPGPWTKPSKALEPIPGVETGFRRADFISVKYLCDGAKDYFLDVDKITGNLSPKSSIIDCCSEVSTIVGYSNGLWWVVVHPSAKKTINSLDEQYLAGHYNKRVVFSIPTAVLDTPDYWTP